MASRAASASAVKAKGQNLGHHLPAKKCTALTHTLSELQQLLPSATYSFVDSQVYMPVVKKHGRRWCPNDKLFAMYQSRKAYKLLQKIFTQPFQRTLQRDLQSARFILGLIPAYLTHWLSKFNTCLKRIKNVCWLLTRWR